MAESRGPNGRPLELASGHYKAAVYPVGAALGSLTWRNRHLVLPLAPHEIPPAYSGKVLLPWPNRITGGRYVFGGAVHQLPVNEPETGSALHGLVAWQEWTVAECTPSRAVLKYRLMGQPGYPFPLDLRATYTLDAEGGLLLELSARNPGTAAAPYGASVHPYLTADGASVDRCVLDVPARRVLGGPDSPGRPLPLGELRDTSGTPLAFHAPEAMAGRSVDHAFTGLPGGEWQVSLTDPATGFGALLTADGSQSPWLQVYSGEKMARRGVAVEPMTCPPDAFNSGENLITLAPGGEHRMACRISAVVPAG
ncbi:aldose-1-epimerase [Arthrobacter sp. zg-Y916]|uniref:aldose-1-epimerase n=1 Tax=Arthrobacter sp. zg-Y916 TaxID=2894190 RepID=UPI001E319520|nr:aldose-1-epimerase [Arthrobacter sp. zg-Y916]MCC9194399.1 aldose-1-epimerase [Arthrobacter sp. zg-Y916]